jgi:hypothetical protein
MLVGEFEGLNISVVVEPMGEGIITGYPEAPASAPDP